MPYVFCHLRNLVLLVIALLPQPAWAEKSSRKPIFDVYQELIFDNYYNSLPENKAHALGAENWNWTVYGYPTLDAAREEALRGCEEQQQQKFPGETLAKCVIVFENQIITIEGPRHPKLIAHKLPEPDGPLQQAMIMGEPATAKKILLSLHGCAGRAIPSDPWMASWTKYFFDKGFSIIVPDSFADKHAVVCGRELLDLKADEILRLRVAQTSRTMDALKVRYPQAEIYIWGHSQGGLIAQFKDYGVEHIIVTGADCVYKSATPLSTKLLHIIGENDEFSPLGDQKEPLSPQAISEYCESYSSEGEWQFVIVEHGDHFVKADEQATRDALDSFLSE